MVLLRPIFLCLIAVLAVAGGARAQSAVDFYRGKKELVLVTSSSVGGGYDHYSRLIDRGMPTAPLMYGDKSKTQFEAVNFSWIGSAMSETGMGVLSARSVVKNIEDAKRHEIFFGTTGPETDPAMFGRLINDLLGTKIKSIHG